MVSSSLTASMSFVVLFFLVYFISTTLNQYNRLRHIPGPPSAGFSKWWFLKITMGGKTHIKLREASDRYGSLVRIGPNELATSNSDDWRKIAGVKSKYTRTEWHESFQIYPGRDNIISQRDEVMHKNTRAKMSAGYSGKENPGLESTIDTKISGLIQLLSTHYLSTPTAFTPVDMAKPIMYFTLDTTSELAFGRSFGDMENNRDAFGYIAMLKTALPVMLVTGVSMWLSRLARSPLLRGLMPTENDRMGLGRVMGMAKEMFAERFGPDKKIRQDMMGSFVKHGLTQERLESETMIQMYCSDTTATTMSSMLIHVITSPRVYTRFTSELASPLIPISSPITDAQARQLPYLQAVIKESLRVLPPAIGIDYREVPAGGDVLSGKYVPAGTWVGHDLLGVLMNEEVFGPDARFFRPERWLFAQDSENEVRKIKKMEQDLDLVFSYGKSQCLGKNIAWMELNKVVPELLRRFEIEIVYPMEPMKSFTAGLHLISDLWMKVAIRDTPL